MLKFIQKFKLNFKNLTFIHNQAFHKSSFQNKQIEIFIDGQSAKVDDSYTIFQACYENGVIIPRFCYHERLAVAGNCRMCLVEIENVPKPVAACASQVVPGMKVKTSSEKTRIHRGNVMEFLLANHPLDCPICDQGGECDLQDISVVYGYQQGRYREYKRSVEDKNYGPLVATSMNRCIHCTRCIRFATQICGVDDLGKTGRGKFSEIGTYVEKTFNTELSGNVVDICPVGALTNAPYAFTSRPWELKGYYTTDVMDTIGSAIQVDTRGPEIMRILPRIHEEINDEWISDKTRHAFDGLKKQRLRSPMQRSQEGTYTEMLWEDAMRIIAEKLQGVSGQEIGAIIGEFSDIETITALKDFLNRLDCENFEIRGHDNLKLSADFRANYLFNSRILGIEECDLLLLIGTNPRYESPVLNSRILKQTKNNLKVFNIGTSQDLMYKTIHLGNSTKVLNEILEGKHPFCERLKKAKLPMILCGANLFEREDGKEIMENLKVIANNYGVISEENKWNGFNILHKECGKINALELGISTSEISPKKPKVVFLLGADNNIKIEDIPEDSFVVYLGTHGDEGAYFADIILPTATYTEKNATWVNTEGRVQQGRLVVMSPGDAREDWMVIRALSEECGVPLPYDTLEELRYRVAELAPHLLKYDFIEPTSFGKLALQPQKGQNAQTLNVNPITDYIDNFYMTDAISRASVTMAKCSTAFNHEKFDNFKNLSKQ
ncbi:NADH dehydrogenase fe-s protein 1, putative [Ichthyophthirius multifiliis]|uniref:NADH dehydrogenase fe-s protein 1, putative n=1 Tax=Ichthyophthirius multifiliis TaxID=5932 RepID=G0R380_ICHMU|nr:NADH dehydrogenase fe-s protein 1, putative [Ichthyophthirius multifiliis]EGR28078.1 NADH dehydrogenase fe-s protein 1, putative [Ichthyophthirius multifiliis]|eukprot:XP_004027423.1 NADH dehydrogenase fe-s protein 1, putative [Ichthyophthirius multifiliis]